MLASLKPKWAQKLLCKCGYHSWPIAWDKAVKQYRFKGQLRGNYVVYTKTCTSCPTTIERRELL